MKYPARYHAGVAWCFQKSGAVIFEAGFYFVGIHFTEQAIRHFDELPDKERYTNAMVTLATFEGQTRNIQRTVDAVRGAYLATLTHYDGSNRPCEYLDHLIALLDACVNGGLPQRDPVIDQLVRTISRLITAHGTRGDNQIGFTQLRELQDLIDTYFPVRKGEIRV